VLGLPNGSVNLPAAMLAFSVPSVVMPPIVNRAVVLPFNAVTPVTVAPAIPERTRSLACSEPALNASLKLTSRMNGPGKVKTPPGKPGFVDVTAIGTMS
jgi:hypothetical protein